VKTRQGLTIIDGVSFLLMSSNRSSKRQVRGERGWMEDGRGSSKVLGSVCPSLCEYEWVSG